MELFSRFLHAPISDTKSKPFNIIFINGLPSNIIVLYNAVYTETMGFDIEACEPRCSVKAGVFDLYATKVNALRLAVDAAITVLRYV